MAVLRDQVSTVGQAYDYFMGSASAAAGGVCPTAQAVYMGYAAKAAKQAAYLTPAGQFNKAEFLADLAAADAACKAAPDYTKKTGSVVPKSAGAVDPSTGGAAPPVIGAGPGAGFPWWIVLLLGGGALAYYLYTKKGKKTSYSGRRSTRRKYGVVKRRRKGRGRRAYTVRKSR